MPEPENEHDPNAVAVWNDDRSLQVGYVPREVAPELAGDEQAVSLWRVDGGLRVLIVPRELGGRSSVKVYAWQGPGLFEVAFVELEDDRLSARGTQLAAGHRLSYVLPHRGHVRERAAQRRGRDRARRSHARPAAGNGPLKGDVLDVDVAGSPLFNSLPVLRDRLHEGGEAHAYAMAYVRVPELAAERAAQRYVPLERGVVRYRDATFTADIEFDADGFVVRYPGLAERVS